MKMPKIVIIGNSAAGFSCCNYLLENLADKELVVVSQEEFPPYRRDLLFDYLADTVRGEDLFLCPTDFFEKNNIKLFKGLKAARVDTRRQSVILKDNSRISYDYLVVASGLRPQIPDLPGNSKDGVVGFYTLEDAIEIKEKLIILDTVCIVAKTEPAMRLYEILSSKNKHVKVISSPRYPNFTPGGDSEWIEGLTLTEIIGEGAELRALKLSNGKAIGTSLILFAADYRPACEFLKDSGVELRQGYIAVDNAMCTNLKNIFSCGAVCRGQDSPDREKSWDDALSEGILAAKSIINSF